jgi:integrase
VKQESGRYHDGGGLYLVVKSERNASWQGRYERLGRERWMGLGSARVIGLKAARAKWLQMRVMLANGEDPLEARRKTQASTIASISFAQAAAQYFDQHSPKWSSAKHCREFTVSLQRYVSPFIGALCVSQVDTPHILRILEQPLGGSSFWQTHPATADRVRGRVENVLDWARARGYRTGDNPAAWTGHLDNVLPRPAKLAKSQHLAAMPYVQLPAFIAKLQTQESIAARALELLILTASRSNEIVGARWEEFDLDAPSGPAWTVPKTRMKARREHKIPLSPAAVRLLRALPTESGNPFVFIGTKPRTSIVAKTMRRLLERFDSGVTVHGFRSSFRVWAAERTNYPAEVAEQALAHTIGSAVERAYNRTTLFDHRRRLMEEWATHCFAPPAGDVVPLRRPR